MRLFACFFFLVCCSQNLFAEHPPLNSAFESLKARYLKLRNTDVQIHRRAEWEELSDEFVAFVTGNPKNKDAARALMQASILHEEIYRKAHEKDELTAVIKLLDRIARDYPGNPLVDDALIKRGDLLLQEMHDPDAAKKSYAEVVEAYADSDMAPVARARLKAIASGGEDGGSSRVVKTDSGVEESVSNPSHGTSPSDKKKELVIVIDPGHGGEDYGAVGPGGLMEKDITLAVALELEQALEHDLGAVVRLTRRKDIFVPLSERTALANDFDASMFISLHVNASPNGKLSGLETYYLDNTGDKSSKKLAERENSSTRFEGQQGDLQFMLSDLIQNAKLDDSVRLANILERSVYSGVREKWSVGHELGAKKAPFYVLVGAHMPCVLVEMFFIDHPVDGAQLAKKEFRKDLARGLFQGIKEFVG